MKQFYLSVALALGLAQFCHAQEAFRGLERAMDSETYERAGLAKLSSDERAVLDQFVRDYVAGKQKVAANAAAAQAVDQAVKEKKVVPPDLIESAIVGTYRGYGIRTIFRLANGQLWKPTNSETVANTAIENPKVIISHDFFGYQMAIEGATTVRVKRVQ